MDKNDKPFDFPAFPIRNNAWKNEQGMTLRDHFAGLAMQAAVTAMNMKASYKSADEVLEILELIPKNAYYIADKMLEQREK